MGAERLLRYLELFSRIIGELECQSINNPRHAHVFKNALWINTILMLVLGSTSKCGQGVLEDVYK